MRLRLVAYMQRRNVHKRHQKRDRMSRLVAKHWFAMKWRYNQPLRIIARRRVENDEKLCAEVVEQVRRDDAALVFRRAIRRWLDWKYLCRRFDAQRERLDLEETLRERLASAECIQRNWLAYLERCAERARVLALRDRDARREELELQEDAAFQIQRCVQCYLFNRLLELRFQAAAQRLDAEREQRRRVDAARHERRDAEKAQELAEQALKQVELSSWKMGADEEGTNYYYNWVTGESSYEKPEGWYCKRRLKLLRVALTPSTRLVSIREGAGWSFFDFEVVSGDSPSPRLSQVPAGGRSLDQANGREGQRLLLQPRYPRKCLVPALHDLHAPGSEEGVFLVSRRGRGRPVLLFRMLREKSRRGSC